MIQGCLLRTQKCLVGRSHEVSSKVPARTRCRPSPGLPVLKSQQPHSGQTRRRETVEISGHCAPASRGNRERNRKFADSFAGGDWIRTFGSPRRYASVSDSSTVTACLGLSPRRRLRFTIRRASLRLVLAEGDPYLDLPVLPSPSRCGPCWRRPRPNLPR